MPTSGELRCCRRELLGVRSAAAAAAFTGTSSSSAATAFTGERRERRNGSEAVLSLEF
jgi:hypothetical protein